MTENELNRYVASIRMVEEALGGSKTIHDSERPMLPYKVASTVR